MFCSKFVFMPSHLYCKTTFKKIIHFILLCAISFILENLQRNFSLFTHFIDRRRNFITQYTHKRTFIQLS